jgi:PAS domain S-box-containing protein
MTTSRLFAGARAPRVAALSALALVTLVSLMLSDGSVMLGFLGVIVCMASVTAGMRAGLWHAGVCALVVLALAGLEHNGVLQGAAPRSGTQLLLHVAVMLLMLGASVAVGAYMAQVTQRYVNAAREREQRFRGLLRVAADWYWEMDEQFRFTHLSEVTPGVSGMPLCDRIGRTPWEVADIGVSQAALDAHRADLEARRSFQSFRVRRRDASGRLRVAHVSGEPLFDARGVFKGYWGVGRDVTAEMKTQQAMAASETRYRELFTRTPSPLVLHRGGRVFDANPAALRMFGYPDLRSMLGKELAAHYDGRDSYESVRSRIALLERLPVGEGLPTTEFKLLSADGRRLTVQGTGVRVDAQDGPAILSIYFDETERLEADAALRRSEGMLSHLVATSPNIITLTELDTGRFAMMNESFTRITGYTHDETIGRTSLEIGLWRSPEHRQSLVDRLVADGRLGESVQTWYAKNGSEVMIALSAALLTIDGRRYIVVNGRDVTEPERVRLEYQAILQNASIGIAFTRDKRFVQANQRAEEILGWPDGTLIGKHGSVVWPSEEEYTEFSRAAAPLLAAGRPMEVVRPMRRCDGSVFWCRLLGQAVDPSHPSHGGTIWIIEDITERRTVEQALEAARDAAEAASRAKSAFLANTSHEIRTPLNGLLGLAQLAQQPGLDAARRQQYLRQIFDSAENLSGIISDILDLSKIEAGKLTLEAVPFKLHMVLNAVQRSYHALAEARGLRLSMHIHGSVPHVVQGDPVRLRQILSNYITNALKFTERGQVRIDVGCTDAGLLRIAVSDTGMGIDNATLTRLFKPFTQADESTTRRYGGTGLGLSICRELAELMGGTVGVESRIGHGSTFWAELPLQSAQLARSTQGDTDTAGDPVHGARLLMVEDNPVNMMIAVALLEQWGAQVTEAIDGRAALEEVALAIEEGRPFDAILMDVQMPVMSGHEAARALRQQHDADELPIIALTAAALVSEREEAMAAGMNDFLTKPIDAQRLRQVLSRWVVDHPRSAFGAPPRGGATGGPAEPDPQCSLGHTAVVRR